MGGVRTYKAILRAKQLMILDWTGKQLWNLLLYRLLTSLDDDGAQKVGLIYLMTDCKLICGRLRKLFTIEQKTSVLRKDNVTSHNTLCLLNTVRLVGWLSRLSCASWIILRIWLNRYCCYGSTPLYFGFQGFHSAYRYLLSGVCFISILRGFCWNSSYFNDRKE